MFETKPCPDCNGRGIFGDSGNGVCAACTGSGHESDLLDAFAKAVAGDSQRCETCGGSGKCRTCYGKGYLNT